MHCTLHRFHHRPLGYHRNPHPPTLPNARIHVGGTSTEGYRTGLALQSSPIGHHRKQGARICVKLTHMHCTLHRFHHRPLGYHRNPHPPTLPNARIHVGGPCTYYRRKSLSRFRGARWLCGFPSALAPLPSKAC